MTIEHLLQFHIEFTSTVFK